MQKEIIGNPLLNYPRYAILAYNLDTPSKDRVPVGLNSKDSSYFPFNSFIRVLSLVRDNVLINEVLTLGDNNPVFEVFLQVSNGCSIHSLYTSLYTHDLLRSSPRDKTLFIRTLSLIRDKASLKRFYLPEVTP